MDLREAERNLLLIRSMMERATRWTGLPAYACFGATACALAGWGWSLRRGLDFAHPAHAGELLAIWTGVAAIAAVLIVVCTAIAARRRGEPADSRLTRSVVYAMLPGLFAGGVLTLVAHTAHRPGIWMLCYGTALFGLGLYAGWKANLSGLLFLACGTLSLLAYPEAGVTLMAVSFGGIHALLGTLLILRLGEDRHERIEGHQQD